MCHNAFSILDLRFAIANLLKLFYLDLCKTLTVALLPLVLLAAFLFENNDLIVLAVAYYRGVDCCSAADLSILSLADQQSIDRHFLAFFLINSRHTKRLAAFDRKLLSACFDDCVTHFC